MTRIYYNKLYIDDANETIEIYNGCPYDEVPDHEVDDYIEEKMDWGEWNCWVIPNQCIYETIYVI